MAQSRSVPTAPASTSESPPIILPGALGAVAGSAPGAAAGALSMAAGAQTEQSIATTTANASAAVLAVLARLSARRVAAMRERLLAAGEQVGDVDNALAGEAKREQVYQARAKARVDAGLKLALRSKDPSVRASASEKVMRREQRFAEQRSSAAAERVLASAELEELRRISPQGAYWRLGPRRTHTADCLAMASHFWPWSVLSKVHPLLHVGCGCYLISLGQAIAEGLMAPGDIPTDAAAHNLAAPVIRHIEEEAEENAAKYGLEEEAERELTIRVVLAEAGAVSIDLLAAAPLRADAVLMPPAADPSTVSEMETETEARAMVALYPSPAAAKALAIPGGADPRELHVTLAFLGETKGLSLEAATKAVKKWAERTPVLDGEVSGIGHFNVGRRQNVTYRSIDLPKLPGPREELVTALASVQVPPSTDHGFTPHMTIADKVIRAAVMKRPISFSAVTLTWGDQRFTFQLQGS